MSILLLTEPVPPEAYRSLLRQRAPQEAVWTRDEPHDPAAVEAVLAWRLKPGEASRYPALRLVASIGAGVDKLLAAGDLPPQVAVTRSVDPGQHLRIAQYVLGCALRHSREWPRYAQQQAAAQWLRHPVRAAAQCRVGILGLGAVGSAIARAFAAIGYPVAGWARSARPAHDGVAVFAGNDGLAALLAQSDILVGALPLTTSTQGLLNRERLALLPRGAYLINIGRGEHLVEADLRALLDAGHLAGAALDVFEREPPAPENWVWRHPLVFATPHIAGEADRDVVAAQLLQALQSARQGQALAFAVDRTAGY